MMRRLLMAFILAAGLSACGGVTLWRSSNDFQTSRDYGVVVSQRQGRDLGSTLSHSFDWFTGPAQPTEDSPVTRIEYVIAKDNGEKVTVTQTPENNDPIFFAGQRVMLINNDGYLRVVSPDPEYKREPRGEP